MNDKVELTIRINKKMFNFLEKWNKKYGINLEQFIVNRLGDWMVKEKSVRYSSEKDRLLDEYETACKENNILY